MIRGYSSNFNHFTGKKKKSHGTKRKKKIKTKKQHINKYEMKNY